MSSIVQLFSAVLYVCDAVAGWSKSGLNPCVILFLITSHITF